MYAIPDHSGKIIEIAHSLMDKLPDGDGTLQISSQKIRDLAYIAGYLYFTYETSAYDSTYDHGWREGYRRVETASYRLNPVDQSLELLFSY